MFHLFGDAGLKKPPLWLLCVCHYYVFWVLALSMSPILNEGYYGDPVMSNFALSAGALIPLTSLIAFCG